MAGSGSLELAHARLSARHGARPDAAAWQRIEPIRALPALIDATRATPLSRWLSDVSADSDSHAIERALRTQWRREVREVAAWMPEPWQASVRWWATWVDLPVLEHLARAQALPPWAADDTVYRQLRSDGNAAAEGHSTAEPERSAVEFAPALRSLAEHPGPDTLLARWCTEWRARMPVQPAAVSPLGAFCRLIERHLASFTESALRDGWPLRRTLEQGLAMLFRKALLEPAATFVYLALVALDLERLRGELTLRAIFKALPSNRATA